jgi:hypothetical protein
MNVGGHTKDLIQFFKSLAFGFTGADINTFLNAHSTRTYGMNSNTRQKPIQFQPAYQPNAPCGLKAFRRDGHVILNTKLKNQVVAVARDMPRSRT